MARLEIRLLGSLEVTLDEQPLSGFKSDKVRALLTYWSVARGVDPDFPRNVSKRLTVDWRVLA